MIVTSVVAYGINALWDKFIYSKKAEKFDFEVPLTRLVWITSILSIGMTYGVSCWLLNPLGHGIWFILASIISCGTLGAALIPEFTKIFTSPKAKHTEEVVTASREGGASLTILSGIVSGNFSGFWIGAVIVFLMALAYVASTFIPSSLMSYSSVFAFGLVAFGLAASALWPGTLIGGLIKLTGPLQSILIIVCFLLGLGAIIHSEKALRK